MKGENSMAQSISDYLFNDPSSPDFTGTVAIPACSPTISINGYVGGNQTAGTDAWRAACVAATLANAINNLKTFRSFTRWLSPYGNYVSTPLTIRPLVRSSSINAYYARDEIAYYYANIDQMEKNVYTAESTAVVAHELGHGVLDVLRPALWDYMSGEIAAFHESFADLAAVLSNLFWSKWITRAAPLMGQDSILTRLGQEAGTAIYYELVSGGYGTENRTPSDPIRNIKNNFTWLPYKQYPRIGQSDDYTKITRECHSVSRVFSGAIYDILSEFYSTFYTATGSATTALQRARTSVGNALFGAMITAPTQNRFYNAIATRFVNNLIRNDFKEKATQVFRNRLIMSAPAERGITDIKFKNLQLTGKDVVKETRYTKQVFVKKEENIVLADHMNTPSHPIFKCEVKIPREEFYEFAKSGRLMTELRDDRQESLESAAAYLQHLHDMKRISGGEYGDVPLAEWKIVKQAGKPDRLVRLRFF